MYSSNYIFAYAADKSVDCKCMIRFWFICIKKEGQTKGSFSANSDNTTVCHAGIIAEHQMFLELINKITNGTFYDTTNSTSIVSYKWNTSTVVLLEIKGGPTFIFFISTALYMWLKPTTVIIQSHVGMSSCCCCRCVAVENNIRR